MEKQYTLKELYPDDFYNGAAWWLKETTDDGLEYIYPVELLVDEDDIRFFIFGREYSEDLEQGVHDLICPLETPDYVKRLAVKIYPLKD